MSGSAQLSLGFYPRTVKFSYAVQLPLTWIPSFGYNSKSTCFFLWAVCGPEGNTNPDLSETLADLVGAAVCREIPS